MNPPSNLRTRTLTANYVNLLVQTNCLSLPTPEVTTTLNFVQHSLAFLKVVF